MGKILKRGTWERLTISTNSEPIMIDSRDHMAAEQLAAALRRLIVDRRDEFGDIVFVCIGTDRATGDALGPLVGHLLASSDLMIYGSLESPVHAGNLMRKMEVMRLRHNNPLVVAIDACLGSSDKVSKLIVKEGGIAPAMAMGEGLPHVGHISIAGIVNVSAGISEQCPLQVLSATRLWTVMQMAQAVANGLILLRGDGTI